MNRARKGREREHQTRKLLEQAGYTVTRSAASLGLWDLIAIGDNWADHVLRVVQVRSNRRPRARELQVMREWARKHTLTRCEVWVWRDRAPAPEIEVL